jgi:Uma2 family endonuclease
MVATERWTSADLAALPEDGKRREIIDGELYVSTQPHAYHQATSDGLVRFLNNWGLPRRTGMAFSALGVIFSEEDDVAPDVAWISMERLAAILDRGKLRAAPDLVAEILSPGSRQIRRDREAKRKLYGHYGVREYWIVDWPRRTIEVHRREGEGLALVATLGVDDTLTSPLLPGFALPLADLFAPIPTTAIEDEGE